VSNPGTDVPTKAAATGAVIPLGTGVVPKDAVPDATAAATASAAFTATLFSYPRRRKRGAVVPRGVLGKSRKTAKTYP